MNDHDVFYSVIHKFTRLKEELAFTSSDLLFAKLWFPLLVQWVIDDAVLVLLKDNDIDLLDKIFLSVNYMNVFDRFIY